MDEHGLNPLLAMLKYPPIHKWRCPFVYYGYDGMSKEVADELRAQCQCHEEASR